MTIAGVRQAHFDAHLLKIPLCLALLSTLVHEPSILLLIILPKGDNYAADYQHDNFCHHYIYYAICAFINLLRYAVFAKINLDDQTRQGGSEEV